MFNLIVVALQWMIIMGFTIKNLYREESCKNGDM